MNIFHILIAYYDELEMEGKTRIKDDSYVFGMNSWVYGGSSFLAGETSLGLYIKNSVIWGRAFYIWSICYIFKSRCQVSSWMCKLIVKRIRADHLKLVKGNLKYFVFEVAQIWKVCFLKK